jgi:hypothetical protein
VTTAPPAAEATPEAAGSVWSSRAACERALAAGRRAPRTAGSARLGTWNVRWYPDGKPGKQPNAAGGTDIAWLACAIAWLNVDAVAVQEFKAHGRAQEKTRELVRRLDGHTNGSWKLELDDCRGGDASQHVGILYDAKRVRAGAPAVLASLNPHGDACKDQLRPGLALALAFPGGLDLTLISVHWKSGSERRSLDLRARSLQGIPAAVREAERLSGDRDVVIAGDLNTMGCRRCSAPIAASEELATVSTRLSTLVPPFRLVPATEACSEYFSGGSALLDHFAVTRETRELSDATKATISGICGESSCARADSRRRPAANEALSDHCPVVLELTDQDLD